MIADQLLLEVGGKPAKRFVFEIVTKTDKGQNSSWHIARTLGEVEERTKSKMPNAEIKRVLEVSQKSNVYGQFEILNAYNFNPV